MAKKAMIEREKKRQRMVDQYAAKRAELKEKMKDTELPLAERVRLSMKLAKLPRNSSPTGCTTAASSPVVRMLLPEAQGEPDRAPRSRVARADPRSREVQLVRRGQP